MKTSVDDIERLRIITEVAVFICSVLFVGLLGGNLLHGWTLIIATTMYIAINLAIVIIAMLLASRE